jgi:hypothetical protein
MAGSGEHYYLSASGGWIMLVDKIIIHHSAEQDTPLLEWAAIRRYQTSYRIDHTIVTIEEFIRRKSAGEGNLFETPWLNIGYHAGTEKVGDSYEVLMGRPWDMNGAHCYGQNSTALGICLCGNFNLAPPPDAQLWVAAKFVAMWMRIYRISADRIFRHSAFNATSCPGDLFDMEKFVMMVKDA